MPGELLDDANQTMFEAVLLPRLHDRASAAEPIQQCAPIMLFIGDDEPTLIDIDQGWRWGAIALREREVLWTKTSDATVYSSLR